MRPRTAPLALALLSFGCAAPAPRGPEGVALAVDELGAFDLSDPDAWSLGRRPGPDGEQVDCLELVAASVYAPPYRSPLSIALVRDLVVGDFVLEADVMQTGREYGHRDFCLFFGFQDPANFYYVHLATSPDPNAHNVFVVDDAARRPLAPVSTVGVDWGTERWHRLRLVRSVAEGTVRVSFDGEVVLEASDSTHGRGRIGFGSFDDTGAVTGAVLWCGDADRGPTRSPF